MSDDRPIAELLASLCDETISSSELARLDRLICESSEARRAYLEYLDLHARLSFRFHQQSSGPWPAVSDPCEVESNLPPSSNPQSLIPNPFFIPPIVVDPSPTPHSLVGNFVFSHIAAAVILGVGLLIGLAWRISLPTSERQDPGGPGYATAVARITALADCKWTKQGAEVRGPGSGISEIQIPKSPNPQIPICLGDRFQLVSGLMQITYDTGAVVLLQAPCTYEIDAIDGGYLAVGKLTALVEKKAEESNPQSLIPNPLFAVRTPTAIVTDLGTEFGVEVEESGTTRSHVFQGKVELRENSRELTTPGTLPLILQAGQSARVERGRNNKVAMIRESGQPDRFVREISKSTNLQIARSSHPQSSTPNPLFHLIDLGTLGGQTSRAFDINIHGEVVGEAATVDGVNHVFLFVNGNMQRIDAPGMGKSCANGINDLGQVVGTFRKSDAESCSAFCYSDGTMRNLGSLGGPEACAYGINNAGQIVGVAHLQNGLGHAFIYSKEKGMEDLGALGGRKANSYAMDINAHGQVAGYSETRDGEYHAFLYSPACGMKDLGVSIKTRTFANRLNDAGQVIGGYVIDRQRSYPFVYEHKKGLECLGNDGTSRYLVAYGVNNAGHIVGEADVKGSGHAFFYSHGQMFDLNTLVEPDVGWHLTRAMTIKDSGQIVGYGTAPDGNTRAFLLTPVKQSRDKERGTRTTIGH